MTTFEAIHERHERASKTLEKLELQKSPEKLLKALEIDALYSIAEQLVSLTESFDRMPIVAYGLKRKDDHDHRHGVTGNLQENRS